MLNGKTVDLGIFMGQSNMAGRGEAENATVCPEGHGYEFRAVTSPDKLFPVTGIFGKNENNENVEDTLRKGDMVSSLMESYYKKTKRAIVGVACSCGGTSTSYWTSDIRKTEAQKRLTLAKNYLEDNGYTINKIFMVWCQGESDADRIYEGKQDIASYKSASLEIFDYMKEAGVGDIFIIKTGHYNGNQDSENRDAAYCAVHDAQVELAKENEHIYTAGSFFNYKEHMKDEFHYHQSAYNEVGLCAGEKIAEIYK